MLNLSLIFCKDTYTLTVVTTRQSTHLLLIRRPTPEAGQPRATEVPLQLPDDPYYYCTYVSVAYQSHNRSPGYSARLTELIAMSPSSFHTEGESSESDFEEEEDSSDSDDEGPCAEDEGYGLEIEEEVVPEVQQLAAPVVDTAAGEPLRLGYGALRRRKSAIGEGEVPNTFEVGQGYGSVPVPEGVERVFVFRQPTLTTWIDPEDCRVYTDILAYVPPVAPIQTPSSLKWSSGSRQVSPSFPAVPTPVTSPATSSPVASPAIVEAESFMADLGALVEFQGRLIHDHVVCLDALPPTLFETYERDFRELYTRSRAIRDEIFSQRYRLRSLEREQERTVVTFGAIWRPVLALESWAGLTNA
ncbi:hypothetical protein Tco_0191010 [Tanacetum coccineum]